ncbi:threonine--tRNA ligase [Candidatus Anaplasma sp. TIGMIC]|uniref:threonine--tRNA ligase n=1 Tax=Candidatus Anaplasma sp. TIGMIC TaxID=3020713 RepID=UPI002A3A1D89|nr:threonine--tRNA ligase [Candidatus Anaplasma sp. TIGMIC]
MINITTSFGDKKSCSFSSPMPVSSIVSEIFKEIEGSVVAVFVDGTVCGLTDIVTCDSVVEPILGDSAEGQTIILRSAALLISYAIKELFPEVKQGTWCEDENTFNYDFDLTYRVSEKDLENIERKAEEIAAQCKTITIETWKRQQAFEFFSVQGEEYTRELLEGYPEGQEDILVYRMGDLVNLYRGPVTRTTGYVRAFKLTKISGVYWQGDCNNKMLQRVTGTAWHSKESLDRYLSDFAEAEKRDHRRIARELEWFHIQNEALGQVFWHPKGWTLYRTVESYLRGKLRDNGYFEIKTPILLDRQLWEKSGHWDKFRESMFIVSGKDKRELAIKPMNCPCHVQVFNSKTRSYKDLPFRMSEFGMCHRNEPSGSLYGLMRVRGFTQDDAHIFCTKEQIKSEVVQFYNLLVEVYHAFGFDDVIVKLSDRPESRIGSEELWDAAEQSLIDSMNEVGVKFEINKGEGAFYGPKLEFTLKDALGREWQCGTIQIDFVLPERLGAYYIGDDGCKHHPVMIHRAILGTLERFIGILIEHYAGNVPAWLAPIQVEILTVSKDVTEYANSLKDQAIAHNIRAIVNNSEESVGQKIRKSIFNKVPVLWVVGTAEEREGTVSVREYGSSHASVMGAEKALKTLVTCVSIR